MSLATARDGGATHAIAVALRKCGSTRSVPKRQRSALLLVKTPESTTRVPPSTGPPLGLSDATSVGG